MDFPGLVIYKILLLPSTSKYGVLRLWIGTLWPQEYCELCSQQTMVTYGRKSLYSFQYMVRKTVSRHITDVFIKGISNILNWVNTVLLPYIKFWKTIPSLETKWFLFSFSSWIQIMNQLFKAELKKKDIDEETHAITVYLQWGYFIIEYDVCRCM